MGIAGDWEALETGGRWRMGRRRRKGGQRWGKNVFWIKNRTGITYFPGVLAVMWNEDKNEDEDDGPASTTEALRGNDVPTKVSETVHQSIYRHYVFYHVFYPPVKLLRAKPPDWVSFRAATVSCLGAKPPDRMLFRVTTA
jgi:hypothetical protein